MERAGGILDREITKSSVEIILSGPWGFKVVYEGNLITQLGDAYVAGEMAYAGQDQMSHMEIGTGTGGTSASTTLVSALSRVALDSLAQGAGANDNDVTYSATWAAGVGTGAITEAGIFNASSAGTMLAYSSFAVKNKGALDTLTINWTITFGSS